MNGQFRDSNNIGHKGHKKKIKTTNKQTNKQTNNHKKTKKINI